VHTGFFAFRPRAPKPRFRFVCAVTDPVVQTAIHALEGLDSRFELHIAGAVQNLEGTPPRGLVFHGALDRAGLRDLYYACDAYVAARPDRTACEASASGLALIATTPQGGPLEAGRDFLSVRDDAQALGASLTALADQHEARDDLARAGAERVREEMDIDRIVAAKLAAMGF
jgi:glycosyltransferase involved in cell wall biosynthesis